jgi:hypothetical protein
MAQYLAGPVLLAATAPTTVSAAQPIFLGQQAFLNSLQGINSVPIPSASSSAASSAASTSAASTQAAPSASASSAPFAATGKGINAGVLGGAIGGAAVAAVLVALFFFLARRRGWCCFGTAGRSPGKHAFYGEQRTPEMGYSDKFGGNRSESALLGTPLNQIESSSRASLSQLSSAFVSHADLNSSRYPSQSELALRVPSSPGVSPGLASTYHDDWTPPTSPRGELPPGAGRAVLSPRESYFHQQLQQPGGVASPREVPRSSTGGGYRLVEQRPSEL